MKRALDRRISVAPMMERTDRHARYLHRLLTWSTLLYTEMVTTGALLHGDVARHLRFDPAVMGGKACIRGMRVTVGTVVGLLATGRTREDILAASPYLEAQDIDEALAYAAWRLEEREVPLAPA